MARPVISRPMQGTRSREDTNRWAAAVRILKLRDYNRGRPCCRFEVLVGGKWEECASRLAGDPCHLVKRRHCGDAWDSQEVLILGCRACHDAYDFSALGETRRVRAPKDRLQAAWDYLTKPVGGIRRTREDPPARYDPERNPDYG